MTLSVEALTVDYRTRGGTHRALDDVGLTIAPGEFYGLVGESGSGKTTAALALVRYLAANATVVGGSVTLGETDAGETDVLALAGEDLRRYRAQRVAMVYQEPVRALNPTMRIGTQIAETFAARSDSPLPAPDGPEVVDLLAQVGFPDPHAVVRRYAHQLSGGQAQRVVIAMALATRPDLLILDEPTTGLDVQTEAAVLALIDDLRNRLDAAVLLISHNLPLVAARCDRVGVLKEGRLIEEGTAHEVFTSPRHAYTRELVEALPDIDAPKPEWVVTTDAPTVLRATGIHKRYGDHVAVDGVDLEIRQGEVLALVGESGSGKTTMGRIVAGLTDHEGVVDLTAPADQRRPVQVVFQSPDATLNPRRTVRKILTRSIRLLRGTDTVEELIARVGLAPDLLDRRPAELSGGQKQRVAIARAFAGPSTLVVCDEPVSALDVSVQARIIALLRELQVTTGVSYLFISHDLAVVRALADRIAVMRHGQIVETGPADQIYEAAQHPYTQALLRAARYQSDASGSTASKSR